MTTMTDVFATASRQLADLACGRTTSVALLEAYLEQIERHQWVNAVVTIDAENALRQAAAADRSRATGGDLGPLHGLPVTIKHEFAVAGLESTYGSEVNRGHIPHTDAEAVARLRRAGAIIFGRTNLPEFSADGQAYNRLHGTTVNPWDPGRTPGGSSGGSAAALAAGMTSLDLGSDMGGSIRLPASWCGVFGLKPTWGVVPATGTAPVPGAPQDADAYPGDVAVAGPAYRLPGAPFTAHRELRAAAWLDDGELPTGGATLSVLAGACRELERDGVRISHTRRPSVALRHLADLFELIFMADHSAVLGDTALTEALEGLARLSGVAPLADVHRQALQLSHREWLALQRDRLKAQRAWSELFEEVDVVLTPTVITTAMAHDHSEPVELRTVDVDGVTRWHRPGLTYWCAPVSVCLLPAVSAPVGVTSENLPVGMQIVAGSYHDRSAIAAAGLLEQTLGGFTPPPLVTRDKPRHVAAAPAEEPNA